MKKASNEGKVKRPIYLSGQTKIDYLEALKPYIRVIENEILPKLDAKNISKSPAYHGTSYKHQVELAISGDIDALRHVGVLMYDGVNLPENKKLAVDLLNTMAFGGHIDQLGLNPPAAYSYAKVILRNGDSSQAIKILKRLIKVNFSPAFALMGNIHQYGYGVEKSFSQADKFYKSAQSKGHIYATVLRAKMYFQQYGLIKKVIGSLLFLQFLWRVVINEITNDAQSTDYKSFY